MTQHAATQSQFDRRTFLGQSAAGLAVLGSTSDSQAAPRRPRLRFGLNADPHLQGARPSGRATKFLRFVNQMKKFDPEFAVDLGDFGIQVSEGQTTREMHDGQLEGLRHHLGVFARLKCPRFHVMGNHDVGWLKGGNEKISAEDLIGRSHPGEDITKEEFLKTTGMPGRFFSTDIHGFHLIILDGNNAKDESSPKPGHDGLVGGYWIDAAQKKWLAADLEKHRKMPKLVFCHEELHHTPEKGSGQGGDTPFRPVGKQNSYVDNGWEIRRMFAEDGHVLACFHGHKHRSRWTVYDQTNYITMAATHYEASFAAITIDDALVIQGFGKQRTYRLPLPKWLKATA